jgi:carbon-monoxide dehydrogenase iron sulfur subunit
MRLVIHPDRCTGCRICEVFCSFEHEGAVQPSMSRIFVRRGEEPGRFVPLACPQCAHAPCAEACPVDAIAHDAENGAVKIDESTCIGCEACVEACPFGAMAFDAERGVPYKCDLCGGDPECARMCPKGAIESMRDEAVVARLVEGE